MVRRTSTQEKPAAPEVCPYLGLTEDRASREEMATREHRCYFTTPPQRVDLDHQRHFCLASASSECPWLTVDELPTPVLSDDPGALKQQQVEHAVDTVGHGVKTAAQVGAPIVKDVLWVMARGVQIGAVAAWNRLAKSHTEHAGQASRTELPATDGQPGDTLEDAQTAEDPILYRIVAPATSPAHVAGRAAAARWRQALAEAAKTVAAVGAFAAALFWLSSIYRGWLPAEAAGQGFWPVFQMPALPVAFTVQHLELTFGLGVGIAPAIGALWAWYTFRILAQEEASFLTGLLLTFGGIVALGQYVAGPDTAIQIGALCQILPSLFVLVARAAREPAQRLIGWSG